jgi:hypothetical protein
VYLDTGQKPADMGDEAAQEIELVDPEPVGDAIDPECVQAGIAEDDLEHVAGGGVSFKDRIDILAEVFEHGAYLVVQ